MKVSTAKLFCLSGIILSAVTANAFVAPQAQSFVARKSLPSTSFGNVVNRSNRAGSSSMRE
jgi:hypothetical protein